MLTVMYISITIFMFVLTLTTFASFYVGLKFWGILDDEKPVEKPIATEVPFSIELLEEWHATLDLQYKDHRSTEKIDKNLYDYLITISKQSDELNKNIQKQKLLFLCDKQS